MAGKIIDVTPDVKWVGILDKDIVTFDIVMETKYGTTYNSYFINADKKAIIDTAKETFSEEYLEKIKEVCDPSEIEVIVANHTEPDHSGSLKHLLKLAPKAKVYGSRQAISYLKEMVEEPFESVIVKNGETLDLGNKTLKFISAPNLHWPDSMYTYLEEDKLLFTCDSFGAHYCHDDMFDDKIGDYDEAFTYYFDVILKPFSKFLLQAIEKIKPLDIAMICPGHGPILRSSWKDIVKKSEKLANIYLADCACQENTILVTYVSAYGYTKQMAENIAIGLKNKVDYPVQVVDIENIELGELESLIVKSNAILVGSPTINQNTLLPIYKMFALINPIRDRAKKVAAFGSFGWSGEAVKLIEGHLGALKLNVIMDGLASRFMPYNGKADQFIKFGEDFAEKLSEEK